MNIYLTPEKIKLLNDQWEDEYDNAVMTDAEWELKRWGLIAKASADNAVRVIIEWLDGDCPHVSHTRARHWCGECYQAIEKLTKTK